MINYRQSLKEIRGLGKSWQKLPVDFGAMYFLLPPEENIRFFGSKPAGRIEKMVTAVRERFKKKDDDVEYYRSSLIC